MKVINNYLFCHYFSNRSDDQQQESSSAQVEFRPGVPPGWSAQYYTRQTAQDS